MRGKNECKNLGLHKIQRIYSNKFKLNIFYYVLSIEISLKPR